MVPYGDIPQFNRGVESEYKRLFYSERSIALFLQKTFHAGYGSVPAGQIVAVDSVTGKIVPYVPATYSNLVSQQKGRAALIVDGGVNTYCYVTNDNSYKFTVGQSLAATYSNSTYLDCGAITAITRDSGATGRAKIEFTNAIDANYTVANEANIYVLTDSSSPYTKDKYVLDKSIDTGTGENAAGALTSVVIANAVLYIGLLTDYDSAVLSDLGTTVAIADGQYLIFR